MEVLVIFLVGALVGLPGGIATAIVFEMRRNDALLRRGIEESIADADADLKAKNAAGCRRHRRGVI